MIKFIFLILALKFIHIIIHNLKTTIKFLSVKVKNFPTDENSQDNGFGLIKPVDPNILKCAPFTFFSSLNSILLILIILGRI